MYNFKNIYILREGRTISNLAGKILGLGDSPFLPESTDILHKIGGFLSDVKFDAFFVSPLPRAMRSYEALQLPKVGEVIKEPRLRALELGDYDGLRFAELPQEFQEKMRGPQGYATRYPKGESIEDADGRVKQWLDEANEKYAGKTIGVMGHWVGNAALVCALMGWRFTGSFDRFIMPHNAVYRFQNGELDFRTFGEIDWYRYRP